MLGHIAGTFEGADGRHYASCYCGWRSPQETDSYQEAARWAVEHSDPKLVDQSVVDMQMQYPDMTRDQVLGLDRT